MAGQKRASDFDTGSSESPGPSCKKTPKRQVTKATFDRWQRDNDRDHQTLVWLRCELERDNVHVAVLLRDARKRHKDSILSLRNFQMTWITGTILEKLTSF